MLYLIIIIVYLLAGFIIGYLVNYISKLCDILFRIDPRLITGIMYYRIKTMENPTFLWFLLLFWPIIIVSWININKTRRGTK